MARITVEDCIDKVSSRFELILIASQRARKLHTGDKPSLKKENDKNTVIALREIEEETISLDELKEIIIKEYQSVPFSENENEEEDNSKNTFIDQDKTEDTSISPDEEEKLEEHYVLEDSNSTELPENNVSESNEDQEKNI